MWGRLLCLPRTGPPMIANDRQVKSATVPPAPAFFTMTRRRLAHWKQGRHLLDYIMLGGRHSPRQTPLPDSGAGRWVAAPSGPVGQDGLEARPPALWRRGARPGSDENPNDDILPDEKQYWHLLPYVADSPVKAESKEGEYWL